MNIGAAGLGKHEMALKFYLDSLETSKRLYKTDHPIIASTSNIIGISFTVLGNNEMALKFYLESLEMFERLFKKDHPKIEFNIDLHITYVLMGIP